MTRRTDAQTRKIIRSVVSDITGQTLSSQRIKLLTNPFADSRIAFDPVTRYIYWIAIGATYHKGPEDLLRAVSTHEVMNTHVKIPLTDAEICEGEAIARAGSDAKKLIRVRTYYEVKRKGWKRILQLKLEADSLSLEWYRKQGHEITWYIDFLIREWNAAMQFNKPRQRFHRLIGIKRVRNAAEFLENCKNRVFHAKGGVMANAKSDTSDRHTDALLSVIGPDGTEVKMMKASETILTGDDDNYVMRPRRQVSQDD